MASKKEIERLRASYKDKSDDDLMIKMHECIPHSESHIAAKLEIESRKRQSEQKNQEKQEINLLTTGVWDDIEVDYDTSKRSLGKKINFIADIHIKKAIFRDIEHAYVLSKNGFPKPAVILAGSVIEELLRQYLRSKNVSPTQQSFDGYIKACTDNRLLESGISRLSDSVRCFRNLVHLANEKSARITLSKATAIGAVSSIFTIANAF